VKQYEVLSVGIGPLSPEKIYTKCIESGSELENEPFVVKINREQLSWLVGQVRRAPYMGGVGYK